MTSEVHESGQLEWRYQVGVKHLINVPVKSGVAIEEINVSERNLLGAIQRGASYIQLRPAEYERAVAMLREAEGRRK